MHLNDEQRAAVCAQGSVVVTAGAGSGKTTVLANRVLFLLIHKRIALQNILVLTFTNKASAEMHERIHAQLAKCVGDKAFLGEPLDDAHIVFLQEQLKTFELARISTIDSFLYKIAQEGAAHFGILGEMSITENMLPHARSFIQRYLMQHKDKPSVEKLIALHGAARLSEEIFLPLLLGTSMFHESGNLELQGQKVLAAIRARIPQCKKAMLTCVGEMRHALEAAGVEAQNPKLAQSLQKFIADLTRVEALVESDDAQETSLEELLKVPLSLQGVTNTKQIKESKMAESLKRFKAHFVRARNHVVSIDATLVHSAWIRDCYKEAAALVDVWVEHKKRAMLFSYKDISELAQKSVEAVPLVQGRIRSFAHIVVDEVQDNSREQNYFLESLHNIAGAATIDAPHFFFVGDPKQSIYKFRGADVQTFIALTENSRLEKHELLHNYRSSPELILFFNEVFSKLFAQTFDEDAYKPCIAYVPQRAALTATPCAEATMPFHVCRRMLRSTKTNEEGKELTHSKEALEAFSIAKTVKEILAGNEHKAEDIAVLARTSALFPHLQKAFLMLGIPYEIQAKEASLRQDIGYDFYAWCALLLTPEDAAAYVSVLRGPLANVSDDAVIRILSERKARKNTLETQELFNIGAAQWEDEALAHDVTRLAIMKRHYNEARALVEKNDLQALLNHFWLSCGYRYILLRSAHTHPFLKQYHILKALIASPAGLSIVSLVETLRSILLGKNDKNTEDAPVLLEQSGASVHIMTIHKSKGLEFPVVILADTQRGFGKNHKSRCASIDDVTYVNFGLPHDPVYALIDGSDNKAAENAIKHAIQEHEESDLYEQLRVLYVACTRAQSRLYISGIASESASSEKAENVKNHRDMLGGVLGEYEQEALDIYEVDVQLTEAEEVKSRIRLSDKAYAQKIDTMLGSSRKAPWQERLKEKFTKTLFPSSATLEKLRDEKETETLPSLEVDALLDAHGLHQEFGTLCHEILKYECLGQERRYARLPATLETSFLRIEERERASLISCAEQCAQRFLSSALWRERSPHARIFTEFKIRGYDDESRVWMPTIVDLIILEDTRCTIVDYKAGLYKNAEKYALQLESYAYALEAFFSTRLQHRVSVVPYVFYLRSSECLKIERNTEKKALYKHLAHK